MDLRPTCCAWNWEHLSRQVSWHLFNSILYLFHSYLGFHSLIEWGSSREGLLRFWVYGCLCICEILDSVVDPKFHIKKAINYSLSLSTVGHSHTSLQIEKIILTLEDMLHACVMDFNSCWDQHLSLYEFTYNNYHQPSLGMAPFKPIYGRPYRSPTHHNEVRNSRLFE